MERNKVNGLADIQAHFEKLLDKTQASKGNVQSITEIEGDILSELLQLGKLLLSERIADEESYLESRGYEVVGEKNQEASRRL